MNPNPLKFSQVRAWAWLHSKRRWGGSAEFREWRRQEAKGSVLRAIQAGETLKGAARAGMIHRATLYRWLEADAAFAAAYARAWEEASERRDFLSWQRHPFRGLRPPTGQGTRSAPRYRMPGR